MECIPEFGFGWGTGWIYLLILAATDGVLFASFPRKVVKRLFDRSGWSQKQILVTILGKLVALTSIFMLIFTPIKFGSTVFIIGSAIALLALLGLIKSLYDYRNTPMDVPVTKGIYRLSRHPQVIMSSMVLLGGAIAIGSWSALILVLLARALSHQQLLAEEHACLSQYGEAWNDVVESML